jgi:hypothetical protein
LANVLLSSLPSYQTAKATNNKQRKNKKEKSMIVKISVTFLNKDSDLELIGHTENILMGMTGNTSYATPAPPLAAVTTAKEEFATAVANAMDGGATSKAFRNGKRAVLAGLLRSLSSYVQVTCAGDLTVLLSSGFPIQKPERQRIGVLPAPSNIAVTLGARTGELQAVAAPVAGAAIYNWRLSAATAPTVWLQTAQTTGGRNVFAGLTPGVVYNIEANVVGSAGPSNWSDPVPLMVV